MGNPPLIRNFCLRRGSFPLGFQNHLKNIKKKRGFGVFIHMERLQKKLQFYKEKSIIFAKNGHYIKKSPIFWQKMIIFGKKLSVLP